MVEEKTGGGGRIRPPQIGLNLLRYLHLLLSNSWTPVVHENVIFPQSHLSPKPLSSDL